MEGRWLHGSVSMCTGLPPCVSFAMKTLDKSLDAPLPARRVLAHLDLHYKERAHNQHAKKPCAGLLTWNTSLGEKYGTISRPNFHLHEDPVYSVQCLIW